MEYLENLKNLPGYLYASAKKAWPGENGATAEVHGYTPSAAPAPAAPAPAAPPAPLTVGARRKTRQARRGGRKHKASRRHARK